MTLLLSTVMLLSIGAIAGLLIGLLGIGCGLIVVPLLIFWLPRHGIAAPLIIKIAIATSLAVVCVSSISSAIAHHRYQRVQWHFVRQYAISILLGASLGALLVHFLQIRPLEILFGLIVILIAGYIGWKTKWQTARSEDASSYTPQPYSAPIAVTTTLIGTIATLIGIGGGTFMIPLLRKLKFPLMSAVGTSVACGSLISFMGLGTMLFTSYQLPDLPAWSFGYLYWPAFLCIAPASLLFSQAGARLAAHINTQLLQGLLALILFAIGIKMLV